MKKLVAAAALLAIICAPSALSAGGPDREPVTILVKFASPSGAQQLVAAAGDVLLGSTENRVEIVKVKGSLSLQAKLAQYRARPDVLYAEPDYIAYATAVGAPSDASYSQQWALAKVQALDGWSLYPGSYGISGGPKIAVVDTGVQASHPDLQGQVDTADGADCVNSSSTCGSSSALDDNGHGTHVAGIAAAATNNGVGVAGTAFSSQVIPVKVLGASGSGSYSAITNGILWAADHGARVISMSLSGSSYSRTLCSAISQVIGRGILVVAAAGNGSTSAAAYPAACPGTVGVAATDSSDGRPSWSNFGSPDVFVSAPGVSIYSTYPTDSYAFLSGTSMATPFVSGLAALLLGQDPSRSPADVKQILASTADKVGGVAYGADPYNTCGCSFNAYYGYGRINVYAALSAASPAPPPGAPTVSLTSTPPSSTSSTDASFAWTTSGSVSSTTCSVDGAAAVACLSPQSYSGLAVGSHSFAVTVSNAGGSNSAGFSWMVTGSAPPPTATYNTVKARHSGQCLDVAGASGAAGGSVVQSPCAAVDDQRWQLVAAGGGYYNLVVKHSGYCLDVYGVSQSAGASVVQWPCNGGANQQWQLVATDSGYVNVVARHSGQCLDVYGISQSPAATVVQWPCNGGPNQQWLIAAG